MISRNFSLIIALIALCFSNYLFCQDLTIEQYIEKYKNLAIDEMKKSGIPASITLAQGIHESANGNSLLARQALNHFGIKYTEDWKGGKFFKEENGKNECYRKYSSVKESFHDHSLFIKNKARYTFLFDLRADDYQGWATGLRNAGYAANPKYPQILISIIEKYGLDKFDKEISQEKVKSEIETKENKNINANLNSSTEKEITNEKREIVIKNGIKATITKDGDTYKSIAQKFKMFSWQILYYNDMNEKSVIKDGDIIYLLPKNKSSATELLHIFKYGETLQSISQQYGIKLKSLLKYNNLETSSVPEPGMKLKLRK